MAEIQEIPITNDEPSFKMRTILEDVQLVFKMDWNTRASKWHLSIMDADETPLVMCLPMNIDTELIARFEIEGLPPGRLMLWDTTENHEEAGLEDLGDRCKLLYRTSV